MELVTEPSIENAETAGRFARELQLLLRTLHVGEANMEKGEMRVEANISIGAGEKLGTKVEVKNLNSFRSVERAIRYEIERQTTLLQGGEEIAQETRGWDEKKEYTFSQRKKESSHDYRYFPDPDLPPLSLIEIPEFSKENVAKDLPELPWQKREHLESLGFLQKQDIEQLVGDLHLARLFSQLETELKEGELVKIAANFILNDIVGERRKNPQWELPSAKHISSVVRDYRDKKISSYQAKSSIVGGTMVSMADPALTAYVADSVIKKHPAVVVDYKVGKKAALQFLIGQGMRESGGKADPAELKRELLRVLETV
jgi:aspartyl-tRNA(Asn)/glutamyl-tRNA(Gln) amidotransferase subunit B